MLPRPEAMAHDTRLTPQALMDLATSSSAVTRDCACAIDTYKEWTRVPAEFPERQLQTVGTLSDDPYVEATFAEYHPRGTNAWSPDAPIAVRHYPYNRSAVLQCTVCGRCCLQYVEAGGYYVEKRIRALDPVLIVDIPV